MSRYRAPLLLGLLLLLACPVEALVIDHRDTTFGDSNWTIGTEGFGTHTVRSIQNTLGGPQGHVRQTDISLYAPRYTGSKIKVYHTDNALLYDPSTQGAITSIDLSFDLATLSGANVEYVPYLIQNGTTYRLLKEVVRWYWHSTWYTDYVVHSIATTPTWTSHAFTGLTASDFTDGGPATPDFSATGSAIRFGFYVYAGVGSGSLTSVSAIDNWSVKIVNDSVSVPEPGLLPLLAPLALLGFRRGHQRIARTKTTLP